MASSESHRQMVVPERYALRCLGRSPPGLPPVCSNGSRALQRWPEAHRRWPSPPSSLRGEKVGGLPERGRSLKPLQALLVESLAPLPDHLRAGIQPRGYLLVGDSFGGQKDDPGANHLPIGGGVRARPLLQDGALLFRRLDAVGALAGHAPSFLGGDRLVEKPYPGAANRTHQRSS